MCVLAAAALCQGSWGDWKPLLPDAKGYRLKEGWHARPPTTPSPLPLKPLLEQWPSLLLKLTAKPPKYPLTSGSAPEAWGPLEGGIHRCTPASLPPSYCCLTFSSLSFSISLPLSLSLAVSQAEWRGQFKKLPDRAAVWPWCARGFEVSGGSKRCAACFLCCNTPQKHILVLENDSSCTLFS